MKYKIRYFSFRSLRYAASRQFTWPVGAWQIRSGKKTGNTGLCHTHTASESDSLKQTMNNTKAIILDLNNVAQWTVHLYTCNKTHVILYVFVHHPFLSQSSIKPGPITFLQFRLAGLGDLRHNSGQCRTGKVILSLCTWQTRRISVATNLVLLKLLWL